LAPIGTLGIRSILSADGKRELAEFAGSKVLVAFDFDGTLAPIASTPRRARMRRTTRALLRRVSERYPCVVISGRARADIAAKLRGIRLRQVFGNHGIEPLWAHPAGVALVHRWVQQLEDRLGCHEGIVVEDKKHSVAIHYRHARDSQRARVAIVDALADLRGARAIEGRAAVNLIPRRGADKGAALARACRDAGCRRAIYVGDDGTDEDAFGALPRERLLGIRIGERRQSMARYRLPAQRGIDALLALLITLRTPAAPHRRPAARR
jgi:trehalose 6-phosphate phosphatase